MSSFPPSSRDDSTTTSEATPLLAAATTGPNAQPSEEPFPRVACPEDQDEKPLPKTQIFLLCYARVVEPIAFFSIFPFINKMILETGNLKEADVGFYSGLIESLFSLTQMLLMISWGRAADRFGRKPVLVLSLIGVSVATALFGLSKTIWQMIFFRCLAGVFAGTIVTIRAMITENSTRKTQARSFSFFAFAGNVGIFVGPFLGGLLSNPAEQYPSVFGHIEFFREYPYALPTFVTGAIGASAAVVSALFIKETLDRKGDDDKSLANAPTSTWEVVKSPGVANVLYIYSHVMLLAYAYTAVLPIFLFTSPRLGGYGFSPLQISIFLGVGGFSQALWLLVAFPPLQHRFGTGGVLRGCSIVWPVMFALYPVANVFLRHGWMVPFWVMVPIALVLGSGVAMAFTAVQLALNDVAPSPSTLGTLNAVAITLVCGLRALAPALLTSIFAAGARTQVLDGYVVWVVMVMLAIGYPFALRWLPKKAEGKAKLEEHTI